VRFFVFAKEINVPLAHAFRAVRWEFDELDVSGPEVADDLFSRKIVSILVAVEIGRLVGWTLTLPQEKQRTGMIILTRFATGKWVGGGGRKSVLSESGRRSRSRRQIDLKTGT
jgi:hypothetical protein